MTEIADDFRVAVIVNPRLAPGLLANAVALVSAGLGAAMPTLAGARLADRTGRGFHVSANRPVPVLQAEAPAIAALFLRVTPPEQGVLVPFPAFARRLHRYDEYAAAVSACDLATEEIDALGLAGPGRWVRSLTGSLGLLR